MLKFYESYFPIKDECYFMSHSELKASRPTLLFIHGLGDSHIDYRSYLNSNLAQHYNILIPDLLGHGKSSSSQNYRFEHQIQGIEKHIDFLQKTHGEPISNFVLIAHSMGGIHATLLCESNLKQQIKAFINVEGSITQFGSFIAENMIASIENESFSSWYEQFKQAKIYANLALQNSSIRPYYASLEFCNPEAFFKNATEMYKMGHQLAGKYTNIIGLKYSELTLPKIYCYGDSMCKETLEFLNEHHLASRYFSCKNHFLLSECLEEFVTFIQNYVDHKITN